MEAEMGGGFGGGTASGVGLLAHYSVVGKGGGGGTGIL